MATNGALPDTALTAVQGSIRLATTTAAAWRALVAAARATYGVTLTITDPAGGYRDLALQKAMVKNPAAYHAKVVAKAGTSVHGTGTCVDVWNWAAIGTPRLDALAARYGFARDPRFPTEPWHYQHNGTTPEEDDMFTDDDRYQIAVIKQLLSEETQWMGVVKMLGEVYRLTGEMHQAIFSTKQDGEGAWDGIDTKLTQVLIKLDQLELPTGAAGTPGPYTLELTGTAKPV